MTEKRDFVFSNEVRKDLLFWIDTSEHYDDIVNRLMNEARAELKKAEIRGARELSEKLKVLNKSDKFKSNLIRYTSLEILIEQAQSELEGETK